MTSFKLNGRHARLGFLALLFLLSCVPASNGRGNELQDNDSVEPAAESLEESFENRVAASENTAPVATESVGLDKQIDDAIKPAAEWFISIVTYSTPVIGPIKSIPYVVLLLVCGAIYFTILFAFPNIRLFPLAIQVVSGKFDDIEKTGTQIVKPDVFVAEGDIVQTIRDEGETGEVSHFQALATAVSGTVGLGNIAGVAVAIAIGGPGATFWMIVCGFLGMSTKFVECTLGVTYRDLDKDGTVHGGPMYYLRKGFRDLGFGPVGAVLGVLFAVLCVGASFGGGNMFQANQVAAQVQSLLGINVASPDATMLAKSSGALIGLFMAVLVAVVIIGGIKRIAVVTEKIVPLMAIIYIGAALIIIVANISNVPAALYEIFAGAFSPTAAVGSMVGVLIVGFQRAAFSNEAGAGSAAIAHSAVRTRYPASEGIVALLEPFIDTVVICTMTAIVIVLFNNNQAQFEYGNVVDGSVQLLDGTVGRVGGVDLTSRAFDSVLPNFSYVLTVAIILFAFSTMISWSYYGLQSWKYLFGRGKVADLSYKLLFCAFVVIGSGASLKAVIDFSDAMILALVFPNMLGLVLLAPRVKQELAKYLKAIGRS